MCSPALSLSKDKKLLLLRWPPSLVRLHHSYSIILLGNVRCSCLTLVPSSYDANHRTMPAGIVRRMCRAMRTSSHDARILRFSGPSHDARGVVRCLEPSCDSTIVRWSGASYDDTRPLSLVDALGRRLANGCTPLPSICAAHWPIDQHRTSLGSSAPKPDMLYYAHNSFA